MQFHIHDFANLNQTRDEYLSTSVIEAHGHLWKLKIYPRGNIQSNTDAEYVSMFLFYSDDNDKTDPVVAMAAIETKTISHTLPKFEFRKGKAGYGWPDFGKRQDIIDNDCNHAGTLTITVELQVATEKRSVWFPRLTCCDNEILTKLYCSSETSDVTFIVGASKKEFMVHKNIIAVRARDLYEMVVTEEESSNGDSDIKTIMLPDVDETAFETILKFIYMDEVPTMKVYDDDEEKATLILLTANRFGCTDLKLYMESILTQNFLIPSTAAGLLLLADSHSCALLKEATMNMYASNSKDVMESSQDDWMKLKESNDLLVELLVYATSSRKKYSSVVDYGNGTIDDVDDFDVTSLRERLQQQNVDLDLDGSREILVERWKNYLRSCTTSTTTSSLSSSS